MTTTTDNDSDYGDSKRQRQGDGEATAMTTGGGSSDAIHSSRGVSFGTNTLCERMPGMLHLMKDDTER